MNKTVTINISGIIFHIEEDAYETLSKYLSTIKGYFNNSEGRDEIVSDIESRIAEMLQERISPTKQVVLMADVDHVITIMGKPEEFAGEQGEEQHKEQEAGSTAADPKGRRRVFRDPDDKVLGGVCAGIGHYFGVNPLWLRLALAFSFFVFGFGFLFYILLWIILPLAKTTAEKLEMRGEEVNINNIHRTFTEEMDDLKKKMNDLKNEASNLGSKENKDKIRHGANRVGDFLEESFRLFGKLFGKVFGILMIIIGIACLIGLLASVFGVHSGNIHFGDNDNVLNASMRELMHILFNSGQSIMLAVITVILLLGVPTLMMIYAGIRLLFGLGRRNRIVGTVSLILWLGGVALGSYIAYEVSGDFSESAKEKHCVSILPASRTLYLRVSDANNIDEEASASSSKNFRNLMEIRDHRVFGYYPSLDIAESANDSFQICVLSSARGATEKEAMSRARNIIYNYAVKDSIVELNSSFSYDVNDRWRKQEVHIVLKVPHNKMVYLSKNMRSLVHNSDISNLQNTYDDDMVGRKWIMMEEGLDCVDCNDLDIIRPNTHHKHHRDENPEPPLPPSPPVRKTAVSTFF
jgi:phage shock protein PspC (stress-responsive transcriptional regulator)